MKNFIVYFHIDELFRDAIVASALRNEVRKRGGRLVYGSRLSHSIAKHFPRLFDAIILPRPANFDFGCDNAYVLYTEGVGRMCESDDINYVLFNFLGSSYLSGDSCEVDQVKKIFLWNSLAYDAISSKVPELQHKLALVGHPRLDRRCITSSLTSLEDSVGVITRQPLLHDYNSQSTSLGIAKHCLYQKILFTNKTSGIQLEDPNNYLNEIGNQSLDLFCLLQTITHLSHSGIRCEVRIHPREDHTEWQKIQKYMLSQGVHFSICPRAIPFLHWAQSKTCLVGPASTSFLELLTLGIKVFSISRIDPRKRYNKYSEESQSFLTYVESPQTLSELVSSIRQYCKTPLPVRLSDEAKKTLHMHTNYPSRDAIENIVNEIALNSSPRKSPAIFRLMIITFLQMLNNAHKVVACSIFKKAGSFRQSHSFLIGPIRKFQIDRLIHNSKALDI